MTERSPRKWKWKAKFNKIAIVCTDHFDIIVCLSNVCDTVFWNGKYLEGLAQTKRCWVRLNRWKSIVPPQNLGFGLFFSPGCIKPPLAFQRDTWSQWIISRLNSTSNASAFCQKQEQSDPTGGVFCSLSTQELVDTPQCWLHTLITRSASFARVHLSTRDPEEFTKVHKFFLTSGQVNKDPARTGRDMSAPLTQICQSQAARLIVFKASTSPNDTQIELASATLTRSPTAGQNFSLSSFLSKHVVVDGNSDCCVFLHSHFSV